MIDEELRVVVESAGWAPSVHNTQPWTFTGSGEALEVRADRSRQLAYLDPTGREMHVSCGAAAEYARLAIRALGHECALQVLPDPAQPDLVARLVVGKFERPTPRERALTDAIARRYTDRGPYEDRPVPTAALTEAQERAVELGVWLRLIDRPDDRLAVTLILNDAEAAEAADPAYGEELQRWTHPTHAPDGMPATALGKDWPVGRVTDVPLRDFSGHASHPRPGDIVDQPPAVERDTLLLLGTPTDDPSAWVATGRAFGWLLLRLTLDGISSQPLGPAIDLPDARARLRHELDLVGWPQFLLRTGYGVGRPRTSRRDAGEVARLA